MDKPESLQFSELHVYKESDKSWHDGMIDEYHPKRGFHIQYYDGDDEWIVNVLNNKNVKIDRDETGNTIKSPKASPRGSKQPSILSTQSKDTMDDLTISSLRSKDAKATIAAATAIINSTPSLPTSTKPEVHRVEEEEEEEEELHVIAPAKRPSSSSSNKNDAKAARNRPPASSSASSTQPVPAREDETAEEKERDWYQPVATIAAPTIAASAMKTPAASYSHTTPLPSSRSTIDKEEKSAHPQQQQQPQQQVGYIDPFALVASSNRYNNTNVNNNNLYSTMQPSSMKGTTTSSSFSPSPSPSTSLAVLRNSSNAALLLRGSQQPPSVPTMNNNNRLDRYQEQNQGMIQDQMMSLHPQGILFVGTVLSLRLANQHRSSSNNNRSSRYFFKVLFIEGGNQPAMFRCKTVIYTSSLSSPIEEEGSDEGDNEGGRMISWGDETNSFRFDMLMPSSTGDNNGGEGGGSKVNISGEVMISIYRIDQEDDANSANAKHILVGNLLCDLTKMVHKGHIFHYPIASNHYDNNNNTTIEGREINGLYSLQPTGGGVGAGAGTAGQQQQQQSGGGMTRVTMGVSLAAVNSATSFNNNNNVGQIEVQFNIAWRSSTSNGNKDDGDDNKSVTSKAGSRLNSRKPSTSTTAGNTTSKPPRPKSASVAGSRAATAANAATTGGIIAPSIPTSLGQHAALSTGKVNHINAYRYQPTVKIASKLERRKKEMTKKIDRENVLLHQRLASSVAADSGSSAARNSSRPRSASSSRPGRKAEEGPTVDTGNNFKNKMNPYLRDDPTTVPPPRYTVGSAGIPAGGPYPIPGNGGEGDGGGDNKHQQAWQKLHNLYETLLQKNSLQSKENQSLKARLSHLNIQIQRQTLGIDRAKSGGLLKASLHSGNVGSVTSSSVTAGQGSQSRSTSPGGIAGTGGGMTETMLQADTMAQAKGKTTTSIAADEDSSLALTMSPALRQVMPGQLSLQNITDQEYLTVRTEYDTLQAVRRGLLARLSIAQKKIASSHIIHTSMSSQMKMVTARLTHMQDDFGDHIILSSTDDTASSTKKVTIATSAADAKSTTVATAGKRSAGHAGGDNKNAANTAATAAAAAGSKADSKGGDHKGNNNDEKEDDELMLYDRWRSLQEEYETVNLLCDENAELLAIESQRCEYDTIIASLQKQIQSLHRQIDDYQQKKDYMCHLVFGGQQHGQDDDSDNNSMNNKAQKMRNFIHQMELYTLQYQQAQRMPLSSIEEMKRIDLLLVNLKMKMKDHQEEREHQQILQKVASGTRLPPPTASRDASPSPTSTTKQQQRKIKQGEDKEEKEELLSSPPTSSSALAKSPASTSSGSKLPPLSSSSPGPSPTVEGGAQQQSKDVVVVPQSPAVMKSPSPAVAIAIAAPKVEVQHHDDDDDKYMSQHHDEHDYDHHQDKK